MTNAAPTSAQTSPLPVTVTTLLGLLISTVLAVMLALYQWMELLLSLAGSKPICDINATFNCEQVWNSSFAKDLQRATAMPVAGWGLIWALVALISVIVVWVQVARDRRVADKAVFMVRLTAVVGVAVSLFLGGSTILNGVFCLTCIGTYLLTISYVVWAARLPGPWMLPLPELVKAGFGTLGLVILVYLVLLIPGMRTPDKSPPALPPVRPMPSSTSASGPAPTSPSAAKPAMTLLAAFLADVPFQAKQAVSDSLAYMRNSPAQDTRAWPPRAAQGPANAPVKITDFTDIRCGHCKALMESMRQIEQMVPMGAFSVEARHFPLDSECNPAVRMSDGKGVRCAAARAMICLENKPGAHDAHFKMFAEQETLTKDRALEIATKESGIPRKDLETCMASKDTADKLKADIDFAMSYEIEGTPLVLVNGRKSTPMPAFLVAIILAEGNLNAPEFSTLPAPQLPPPQ